MVLMRVENGLDTAETERLGYGVKHLGLTGCGTLTHGVLSGHAYQLGRIECANVPSPSRGYGCKFLFAIPCHASQMGRQAG